MMYGLVSEISNETEMTVMRSKKIQRCNIIAMDQMAELLVRVKTGDCIWMITVGIFPSVIRFVSFADTVLQKGGSLRIIDEQYLEVGNGRHFKPTVKEHLNKLMELEHESAFAFRSSLQLTDKGRIYVDKCVAHITVGILSTTYASGGILHRGK